MDANEGGGGIGDPPSAIRTGSCEVKNETLFLGGGGIGDPPSAIRAGPCEIRFETLFLGGGIGDPPSAIRTRLCEVRIEALFLGGGGIGDPPSALRTGPWFDVTADWCKLGQSAKTTSPETVTRKIFLKFILPPETREFLTLLAGYGDNLYKTTSLWPCLAYQAAKIRLRTHHLPPQSQDFRRLAGFLHLNGRNSAGHQWSQALKSELRGSHR